MASAAVGTGFYWTLPVNWTGFRRLPDDVDAAAAGGTNAEVKMAH